MTTLTSAVITAMTSTNGPSAIQERPNPSFTDVLRSTARKLSEIERTHAEFEGIPKMTQVHRLDADTKDKISGASDKMSSFMHVLANEPSIGLYHVSNHITRSVPKCVETKRKLRETTKSIEDMSYDMDYTLITIRDLKELNTFTTIKGLLAESITTIDNINRGIPPQRVVHKKQSTSHIVPSIQTPSNEDLSSLANNAPQVLHSPSHAQPEHNTTNPISNNTSSNQAPTLLEPTTTLPADNDLHISEGEGAERGDHSGSYTDSSNLESSSGNQEGGVVEGEDVVSGFGGTSKKKRKGKDGKKKRKDFTMKTFEI